MDIHLIPDAVATPAERAAIDAALSTTAAPGTRRSLLLPVLHAVASRAGWISRGAINYACEQLDVPPADAYGVASFYAWFSTTPRPLVVARVCDDIACRSRGAESICEALDARFGAAGTSSLDGRATWLRTPCLGQCDRAPAALYQVCGQNPRVWTATRVDASSVATTVEEVAQRFGVAQDFSPASSVAQDFGPALHDRTQTYSDAPRLLVRVGVADPERLDSYRAHGGYSALRHAFHLGRDAVLQDLAASKLTGRGGAAFPTGRKWEAVARAAAMPHYVVCNADESEPGTFKDRVLLEDDPFAIIEAMTIAAFVVGAATGYIYLRAEYPLAARRVQRALAQAREAGLLGPDILRSGLSFDIELRRGAAAYICGEETALFNSIEGFRGEPRNKPPFPVEAGLFGKPTLINNVETFASVLDIVLHGGEAFAAIGTAQSAGTRLFCLSGAVARPGVYEVPLGTPLRVLIDKAGGIADGRSLQAVLIGGAAGVFLTPMELDMPLSFEGARATGASLGSGVVMAFDETADMRDITRRIAAFFRDESCGQCVPCRVGTMRQEELLHQSAVDDRLVDDVAQAMRDASICGLGQTASSAVQSAMRKLRVFELRR